MAFDEVLARIPGLGGYLAQQRYDQQASQSQLGQLLGVVNAVEQQKQRQLQAQMQQAQLAEIQRRTAEQIATKQARDAEIAKAQQALQQYLPGKPAIEAPSEEMGGGPGRPAIPDPRAQILGSAMAIDPNDAAQIALRALGMQGAGAGGAGADPMLTKLMRDRQAAAERNDAQEVAKYDAAIERFARGYTPLQAGRYQGNAYDQELRRRELEDQGVRVPSPGQQPVPQGRLTEPGMRADMQANPPSAPVPDGDLRIRVLEDELARARNPREAAMIQEELARVRSQPVATAPQAGASSTAPSPRDQRAIATAGLKGASTNFIADEYRPTQVQANSARQMNMQIEAFRSLPISKQTGWGTEAKAYGARMLEGLGIAPEEARRYAADAQMFNSIAFQQNWTLLQAQKGPQTEGDSQRAQKVFAQLANTPDANAFIWDFANAVNNATIRKAKFYSDNYTRYLKEGRVAELESQWANQIKDQSIWDAPSMQKWKGRGGEEATGRRVRRTGRLGNQRVIEYEDGTVEVQ